MGEGDVLLRKRKIQGTLSLYESMGENLNFIPEVLELLQEGNVAKSQLKCLYINAHSMGSNKQKEMETMMQLKNYHCCHGNMVG